MMRKSVIALVVMAICSAVLAADTDAFDITVSVNYIDISLKESDAHGTNYDNWPISSVSAGEVTSMSAADHIWVDNGSNLSLDFKAYSVSLVPADCGFGTPAAWGPTGPGDNAYKLELAKGSATTPDPYTTILGTDAMSANNFYTASAGTGFDLWAQFTAPTTVDDGCEHTVSVTILAIVP